MQYINVKVEGTVKWTCICAENAKSAASENARRWECWQNVSTLITSGKQFPHTKIYSLVNIKAILYVCLSEPTQETDRTNFFGTIFIEAFRHSATPTAHFYLITLYYSTMSLTDSQTMDTGRDKADSDSCRIKN